MTSSPYLLSIRLGRKAQAGLLFLHFFSFRTNQVVLAPYISEVLSAGLSVLMGLFWCDLIANCCPSNC